MSYDLYFYRAENGNPTRDEISNYLTENLCPPAEGGSEWFFENERTGVYYSFALDEVLPAADPEEESQLPEFEEFEYTGLTFNLNYSRPDYFGLEAFQFVGKLLADLKLQTYDPQAHEPGDISFLADPEQLCSTWVRTNAKSTSVFQGEYEAQFDYIPLEKSNEAWRFNFQGGELQRELGDDYFVPRIFLVKRKKSGAIETVVSWAQGIPAVLPEADHYALERERKKLFRTVLERGVVSRATLLDHFGPYLGDFRFPGCKIVDPGRLEEIASRLRSVKFENILGDFGPVDTSRLTNVKSQIAR